MGNQHSAGSDTANTVHGTQGEGDTGHSPETEDELKTPEYETRYLG